MRHEPRDVSRDDLAPGDVVAVRHPHGTWSIRRAGAEYIMENAEYVLLERDLPDCPSSSSTKDTSTPTPTSAAPARTCTTPSPSESAARPTPTGTWSYPTRHSSYRPTTSRP